MIYCVNPTCLEPQNSDTAKTCRCCGSILQLHDRYILQQLLAQGKSGRTFLAIDCDSSQDIPNQCVIKQIPSEQLSEEAIQQRVQSLKGVIGHCPHLPHFFDAFRTGDNFYVVYEWIEGQNLAAELTKIGTFSEEKIWQILKEILPALNLLNNNSLIHQDVKPANLIRRSNGSLVLVDVGSADRFANISPTAVSPIGSAEYAAPEQIIGRVCFASDVYSLGVTCLHLLTALSPFDLFDSSLDRWIWQDYLTHPISDALQCVLDEMVQRSTSERSSSAEAVLCSLARYGKVEATIQPFPLYGKVLSPLVKPLPPRLAPFLSFLSRHTASINAVAFHPHLAAIASASDDKTIRFWNCNAQPLSPVLTGHQGSVRSIAFSPTDPALIASASDDKTIRLWNWQTETMLSLFQGHKASVRSIAFSPNGKFLVSGSWDKTIGVWDVKTAASTATAKHALQINAVAVSSDGTWLASGSADRTARLWQLQATETGLTIALRSILTGHTWAVTAVAFSPDEQLLATGSNDNTVKLWQVQTGELLRTLSGHSWSVASVQFSPAGQHLLSGSWDQTIKLWKVETGEELATLAGHADAIHAIGVADGAAQNSDQTSDQTEDGNQTSHTWVVSGGRDKHLNLWQISANSP